MDNSQSQNRLLRTALVLAIITIAYNLLEGIISVYFGNSDNTLTLLGFGIDSFVEVISGTGILHMVLRMQHSEITMHDKFERMALRITGSAFMLLAAGLIAGSVINIVRGVKPQTTFAGIIIAVVSIATMYFLLRFKLRTGKALGSSAIIADANCTRTCIYLSIVLLVSGILYELFRICYIDAAGSLGIAWFAFSEGRESFEKARSKHFGCSCGSKNCN